MFTIDPFNIDVDCMLKLELNAEYDRNLSQIFYDNEYNPVKTMYEDLIEKITTQFEREIDYVNDNKQFYEGVQYEHLRQKYQASYQEWNYLKSSIIHLFERSSQTQKLRFKQIQINQQYHRKSIRILKKQFRKSFRNKTKHIDKLTQLYKKGLQKSILENQGNNEIIIKRLRADILQIKSEFLQLLKKLHSMFKELQLFQKLFDPTYHDI